MEDQTSSGGNEPLNENASPSAVDKSTDAAVENSTEQKVETDEVSAQTQTEENISDDELLAESKFGQPAPQKPEEHRAKNEAKFAGERNDALNRVYASLHSDEWETSEDRRTILDKAIKSERPDVANYLRKEIDRLENGTEAETPSLNPNEVAEKAAADVREREKGAEMFIKTVKSAGLDKKTAFAIAKRKTLKTAADKIVREHNIPPARAVRIAALELGLFDQKKLNEARKEGAKLGRSALTPTGEVPTSPQGTTITDEKLSKLPQQKYNKVMDKVDAGEMKVVAS